MLTEIRKLFNLEKYEMKEVESHEGGRNWIFLCENEGKYHFAIRISLTGDRHQNAYIALTVKPDVHLRLKSASECIKPQYFPSMKTRLPEEMILRRKNLLTHDLK